MKRLNKNRAGGYEGPTIVLAALCHVQCFPSISLETGTGTGYSVLEMVEAMKKASGRPVCRQVACGVSVCHPLGGRGVAEALPLCSILIRTPLTEDPARFLLGRFEVLVDWSSGCPGRLASVEYFSVEAPDGTFDLSRRAWSKVQQK